MVLGRNELVVWSCRIGVEKLVVSIVRKLLHYEQLTD